jgi:hypothetical protein
MSEPEADGADLSPEPTTNETEPVGASGSPTVEPVTDPEATDGLSEPPADPTNEPVDPIVEPVTEPTTETNDPPDPIVEPVTEPQPTIDSPQTPAEAPDEATTVRAHPHDVISQYAAIWLGSGIAQPLLKLQTAPSSGANGQPDRSNGAGKDATSRQAHRRMPAPFSDHLASGGGGAASGSPGGGGSSSGGFAAVVALMALASWSFSQVLRLFLSPPRVTALIADLQRPG